MLEMTTAIVPFKHYKTWLPLEMFTDRSWVDKWFNNDNRVEEVIDGNKTTIAVRGFENYSRDDLEVEYDGEYLKIFASKKSKFQINTQSVYYKVNIPNDVAVEAVFNESTGKVEVTWEIE